ncbi:uncharacterized protein A1O9_10392 [Exophiala aquamarina CBS 119918]|uniref:Zn(2)-C6 fungal-type domain-containing protein n=1 Tax=Exophiala aquamarina CBS 119918 TaxID=1182545 RepID=A0A072P167_9EURO|nr:uncharacterized protein A1O9_10392 [Exophiala aquamarina CBS 119918]KEF53417.1 hypothetical protein A1O9_10392 [Exophiala aquamarina CBS 119918]
MSSELSGQAQPGSAPPIRRRRQLRACNTCHRRKVRCDAIGRQACSNCKAIGAACRFDIVEALSRRGRVSQKQVLETELTGNPEVTEHNSRPHAPESPASRRYASTSDRLSEVAVNQQLVDNVLVDFFQHGIGSQYWSRFDKLAEARICYVGTSLSNLAFLVSQEGCGDNNNLHYPNPQVHRIVPWKPDPMSYALQMRQNLESELSSFPAKDVRDALVEAFFNEIHPGFPVVDESDFRASYADPENPPPLLLFQTILLAGAHVCTHPKVAESRSLVRTALFQRAKTLWDLRFENDRVTLVQAALIFSWHIENADTVSANSYYWISVACGIAYGLGMHRNLAGSSSSLLPQCSKNLFRRIWWTLFQAAVASSLDQGRPLLARCDDSDQPPLTEDDLIEVGGSPNKNIRLQYCVQNSTLCEIVADILALFSPGSLRKSAGLVDTSIVDARLAAWLMGLPPGDDYYSSTLRLHYNTALLHLHRTVIQLGESNVSTNSQKLCSSAAESIVSTLSGMIANKTISRCYFTSLTAIMASAVHFVREMRLAIGQNSTLLALQSQAQLESCSPILRELTLYWPTASSVEKLCQHLLDRMKSMMIAQQTTGAAGEMPLNFPDLNIIPEDWDYILSTLHAAGPEPDWSNAQSGLGF